MKRKRIILSVFLCIVILATFCLSVLPCFAVGQYVDYAGDLFTEFGSVLATDPAFYTRNNQLNLLQMISAEYELGFFGTGVPVGVAIVKVRPSGALTYRLRVYVATSNQLAMVNGLNKQDIEIDYIQTTYNGYRSLQIRPYININESTTQSLNVVAYDIDSLGLPTPVFGSLTTVSSFYNVYFDSNYMFAGSYMLLKYDTELNQLAPVYSNDSELGDFGYYNNGSTDYDFEDTIDKLFYLIGQKTYDQGYNVGYEDGYDEGYADGRSDGFTAGEEYGYNDGYSVGYDLGYVDGVTVGSSNGYDIGYDIGFEEGEASGYTKGYLDGSPASFDLPDVITSVPQSAKAFINNAFGFELFGINIAGLLSVLLIVAIVGFVIKWLMSK